MSLQNSFFESDAEKYACLYWSHHILLGLKEAEQILSENICNSLIDFVSTVMVQSFKKWFNTILLSDRNKRVAVLNNLNSIIVMLQKSRDYISILQCLKHAFKLAEV